VSFDVLTLLHQRLDSMQPVYFVDRGAAMWFDIPAAIMRKPVFSQDLLDYIVGTLVAKKIGGVYPRDAHEELVYHVGESFKEPSSGACAALVLAEAACLSSVDEALPLLKLMLHQLDQPLTGGNRDAITACVIAVCHVSKKCLWAVPVLFEHFAMRTCCYVLFYIACFFPLFA
jgi:hypothetical protein